MLLCNIWSYQHMCSTSGRGIVFCGSNIRALLLEFLRIVENLLAVFFGYLCWPIIGWFRAHPYMFGLSVAGGLVTMGLEGAVFGPVMLCILLVAVQVYRRILEPTTDGAAVSVPSLVMAQIPAMSSDMLISPITPDVTESRILGQIESKIFNTGLDQRDSMTTYQEKDENSQLASSSEEPRPETLSALKRRERLSSLSGLKHSTPRDSVSFAAQPEFGQR